MLAELDLPAALTSLQDALQHAPAAAAAAALALGSGGAEGAVAAAASSSSISSASAWSSLMEQQELQHLMALADVAAQRIADLAEAAALAADPAGAASAASGKAPADNGWLQPLVTGLETVLQYIQVWMPPAGRSRCRGDTAVWRLSRLIAPSRPHLIQTTAPTRAAPVLPPPPRPTQDGLDRVSVPYSYGWSIVTLTLCVKLATFPLTKKQVESSLNMQALKPQIEAIKAQYGDNKEAVQRETSALYEKAGVDPLAGERKERGASTECLGRRARVPPSQRSRAYCLLSHPQPRHPPNPNMRAGCLPSLATIPIFIGLFRSLSDYASRDEAGAAGVCGEGGCEGGGGGGGALAWHGMALSSMTVWEHIF